MYKMFNITKETLENNGTEVIVDSDNALRLNEKNIEENQAIKIYQSSQTNTTIYTKKADMNQQINQ